MGRQRELRNGSGEDKLYRVILDPAPDAPPNTFYGWRPGPRILGPYGTKTAAKGVATAWANAHTKPRLQETDAKWTDVPF